MANLNRVKCTASIDATGNTIIVGAAATGSRQPPADLWDDGSYMTGGDTAYHEYLLESGTQWELGFVDGSDSTRHVVDSNVGAGAGFAVSTTGLTLSFVVGDMNLVASARAASGSAAPRASLNSLAIGPNAACEAAVSAGVAVGDGVYVTANGVTAVGAGSGGAGEYGTAVGVAAWAGDASTSAGGVAVGYFASAVKERSIAIGQNATSLFDHQVVIGSKYGGAFTNEFPLIGAADSGTGTVAFTSVLGAAIDLTLWSDTTNHTTTEAGPIRIRGTVFVQDAASALSSHAKVFDVEYLVWVDPTAVTAVVLGSPTITAMHTGASVPNSTLSISSTGVPQLASTSGTGVTAKAWLKADTLVTAIP